MANHPHEKVPKAKLTASGRMSASELEMSKTVLIERDWKMEHPMLHRRDHAPTRMSGMGRSRRYTERAESMRNWAAFRF
ncbi:MAG: hypothetical protein ACJAWC_002770 [Yoonia sp.]|jgi:hypothetical protein